LVVDGPETPKRYVVPAEATKVFDEVSGARLLEALAATFE
jgi:hypothetical protein